MRRNVTHLVLPALALLLQIVCIGDARAYNVPGSTTLILPSVVRETGFAVVETVDESVKDAVQQLRSQESPPVPPLGYAPEAAPVDPARLAMAYGPEDAATDALVSDRRFALGLDVEGRHVEDTGNELPFDYDFAVGAVSLAYKLNRDLYVSLTGIVDGGSGDTDFNDGDVEHLAVGGAASLTWYPGAQLRFILSGGYSRMEFDVDRSDGAIEGSFDADRVFLDANGSWLVATASPWDVVATAGLRYVHQWNDDYVETGLGGGAVGDSEIGFLRGYGALEVGYDFGMLTPYTLARLGYDLDTVDSNGNPALQPFQADLDEFTGSFGGGVKVELGQSLLTLQGDVRLRGDEYSGYSGGARLGVPF